MPSPRRLLPLAFLLVALAALPARATEWNTIVPGTSTMASVTAQFGAGTRSEAQKVEGYDATQWVYEEAQAPRGVKRLTVDFGLLTPNGYRPEVVRSLRLEPQPGVFDLGTVLEGWGLPTRVGKDGDAEVFFYQEGLLVYFDSDREVVKVLIFTPPQPPPDAPPPRQP